MKKIVSTALAVIMFVLATSLTVFANEQKTTSTTVDPTLKAEVEEMLESKHKLYFNADGSFRVLILADIHMNAASNLTTTENIKKRIKFLIDKENPNLVIFTGDNTIRSSTTAIAKNNISAMVSYIEEKKIPWCHVYGNHDHENALTLEKQQEIYESFEYCISKEGPDLSGVGNYVNGIYNKDGSLGAVIYCLDSHDYPKDGSGGTYDYIKQDQIDWYKSTSEKLQKYNGKVVPALMAFHIPLIENTYAYNNRNNKDIVSEYTGERNEAICSSVTDTNLFETILERGDVKAIVTGHDHVNDYMYNYKGVKLCSSPNFSEFTYTDSRLWGARAFDMNLATINNIPTHVTYINERIDTSNLPTLADNVKLEYTNEAIKNAVVQNWNNESALKGTASISVTADKGVDNSSALMLKRKVSGTNTRDGNFEVYFEISNQGKIGNNKYLIVWADFTNVEFRKACFGFAGERGFAAAHRTDDADYVTSFYYLADGASEWVTLKHGADGCFGVGDNGSQSMKGKKGYFAFPIENMKMGSTAPTASTAITGIYFYGSLNDNALYADVPFYFDDFRLVTDYKTVNAPCKHTKTTVINKTAATCSAKGYTGDTVCSDCGAVIKKGSSIAQTAHSYAEWTQTKAPTCLEKGQETRTCKKCTHKQTRDVDTLTHNFDNGTVTTAPGCETTGVKTYKCTNSGCTHTKTEDIAAVGHNFDNGAVTKAPGCETTGEKTFTCTSCGKTTTEAISATGHAWDNGSITKEPTCEAEGEKTITCTSCGKTTTEAISATGHTWDNGSITKEPTCEAEGEKNVTCTSCGEINTEVPTETIPATGHSFGKYTSNGDATSEKDGTKTAVCDVCGAKDTVNDPGSRIDSTEEKKDGCKSFAGSQIALVSIISFAGVTVFAKKRKNS